MNNEILNGKITSTKLGQDHGCLTADFTIEGDGWGCGFGGYCLDHWCADIGEHSSTDGYGAIIELMKTLEVERWEDLKGQFVRVETNGWGGKIIRIGHLFKDKWFSFKEYFDAIKECDKKIGGCNTVTLSPDTVEQLRKNSKDKFDMVSCYLFKE